MKTKLSPTAFLAAVAMALALLSCNPEQREASAYINLPASGWAYADTLAFPLNVADSIATGYIIVAIDHTPEYRYADLWMELTSTQPGNTLRRDTLQLQMCDSAGTWLGTGVASNYQLTTHPLRLTFAGALPLTLRHILRTDTLRHVNRVGLFFKPQPH